MGQLAEYIKMALKNIKSNKGRSFLTMLGIIIGISSVIMIISVGNGVSGSVSSDFISWLYPRITFIGVRMSWDILFRNSVLALFAFSAAAYAFFSFSSCIRSFLIRLSIFLVPTTAILVPSFFFPYATLT